MAQPATVASLAHLATETNKKAAETDRKFAALARFFGKV
jgi:hypothetical protein